MKLREKSEPLLVRGTCPTLSRVAASEEDGKRTLTGYAVVYDSLSVTMDEGSGPFQERVIRGALDESLTTFDLYMLGFHDSTNVPLGRRAINGECETLKAVSDDYGLRFLNYVPPSPNGDNVYVAVVRKDLIGMSFGFDIVEERWVEENGVRIREITKADIHEISCVIWGAYPAAFVKARSYRAIDKNVLLARQRHAEFRSLRNRYVITTLGAVADQSGRTSNN